MNYKHKLNFTLIQTCLLTDCVSWNTNDNLKSVKLFVQHAIQLKIFEEFFFFFFRRHAKIKLVKTTQLRHIINVHALP